MARMERLHVLARRADKSGRKLTPADVLKTLMHEIQHYIQLKEGFAAGSQTSQREGDFTAAPLAQ